MYRSSWRSVKSSWHSGRRGSLPSRNSRQGLLISTVYSLFWTFSWCIGTFSSFLSNFCGSIFSLFRVVTVVERWANQTFLVPSILIFYDCLDSCPQSRRNGLRIQVTGSKRKKCCIWALVFPRLLLFLSFVLQAFCTIPVSFLSWVIFVISSFSHFRCRYY